MKTEFIFSKAKGGLFILGQDHLVPNLGDVSNCLSRDDQPMLLTNPQSSGPGKVMSHLFIDGVETGVPLLGEAQAALLSAPTCKGSGKEGQGSF